jgi:Uma2 family endonuclease
MNKTKIKIGPADHGRRMSLEDFEDAEGREGYLYELSRGAVTVSDVPSRRHMLLVSEAKDMLFAYKVTHPGRIQVVLAGSECKLLIDDLESERHPDISVYVTPPPELDDRNFWRRWVPDLVIEIVSPSSRKRDYKEKPEEYLRIGVKEYWIIDPDERVMVVMKRSRGRWAKTVIHPPAVYRTQLLPGLDFSCQAVFQAVGLV